MSREYHIAPSTLISETGTRQYFTSSASPFGGRAINETVSAGGATYQAYWASMTNVVIQSGAKVT